jgi:mannose-6-phosphate isomerase-like protein (cupin superfamily)
MLSPIPDLTAVTPAQFRDDLIPAYRPVVLRGFAAHWPAVTAGREGAIAAYLKAHDVGAPVQAFVGSPEIGGKFFYAPEGRAFNFTRREGRVSAIVDEILANAGRPDASSVYVGSTPAPQALPGFAEANPNPVLGAAIIPRVWIGGETVVATHYDLSDNIAIVVAGRRRFTLIPPEQTTNLYVGPLDFTPAGQPVSMVDLEAPDLARYPKFAQALDHAMVAELEPGDAIYIPALWWHHVRSIGPLNVLVNYWWNDLAGMAGSPFEVLIHALMSVRHLPAPQRAAWRVVFEHYVFGDEDPGAHLAPELKGVLGPLSPQLARNVRAFVGHAMKGS